MKDGTKAMGCGAWARHGVIFMFVYLSSHLGMTESKSLSISMCDSFSWGRSGFVFYFFVTLFFVTLFFVPYRK